MATIQGMDKFGVVYAPQSRITTAVLSEAVESWKTFCRLPWNEKRKISYRDGIGYEVKEVHRVSYDRKENFHFSNESYNTLSLQAMKLENKYPFRKLLSRSLALTFHLRDPVLKYAAETEKRFGLRGLVEEVERSRDQWTLRYLHYFPDRQYGEEIAAPHADKSGFTLHLYESERGLEFLPYDGGGNPAENWMEIPMVRQMSTIIPSMQLQLKTKGRMRALCHRVVAESGTVRDGRYAVVCFIPFTQSPKFDKEKAGRLQEFQPGFNYNMPFEEFSKLFV